MKLWHLEFKLEDCHHGGVAFVVAESEDRAIQLLKQGLDDTVFEERPVATEVPLVEGIIYRDLGGCCTS